MGRALAGLEVWMRYSSLVVVFVVGCGGAPAPMQEVVPVVPVAEVKLAAPVEPVAVPVAAPVVVADGKVGVAACDEYLDAYRGCIDSLDAKFQGSHRKVVEQLVASWRIARADDKVAGTLEGTCGSTRAASKLSLPACTW